MSSVLVRNQCLLPIQVGKLYVHVRPSADQESPCARAEEIEDVEVVEIRKSGEKFFAIFRRSGEGVDWNSNWVDINLLRLRLFGGPCA